MQIKITARGIALRRNMNVYVDVGFYGVGIKIIRFGETRVAKDGLCACTIFGN